MPFDRRASVLIAVTSSARSEGQDFREDSSIMSSAAANIEYAMQIESATTAINMNPQNEFQTAPPSPSSSSSSLPLSEPSGNHLEKDSGGSGVARVFQGHWSTSTLSSSSSLIGSLNTESNTSLFTSDDSSTEEELTDGFPYLPLTTSTPLEETELVSTSAEPGSTRYTTTLSVLSSASSASVFQGSGDVWNKTERGNTDRKSGGNFPIGKKSLS